MRSAILTSLALVSVTSLAQAQVLASDDFSTAGALTSNGWIAHSGAGNKMIMSDGNVATLDESSGSGEDVNMTFAPQLATDTTYAAFDLNVPAGNPVNPDANGLYMFHLKDSAFAFRARTGLLSPAAGGDFVLAINVDSSALGAGAQWASDLSFGTTYRVVVSYDAAAGSSQLWLDPVDANSTSITSAGGTMSDLIEGVAMRQSNDYTGFITVDNVVAGMTFADVLGGGGPSNSGSGYCFGDGTGASCPCSAFGGTGQGCANSGSTGATLTGTGNASFTSDSLGFTVSGVAGARAGLLLRGNNQISSPVGNGLLCVAGQSGRSATHFTDTAGNTSFTEFQVGVSFAMVANAGAPTNFQYWYRDDNIGPCTMLGFNFSNAWTVTYLP